MFCPGTPGHGSLLLPGTAGEKLRVIIDKFMDFRQKELDKLAANPKLKLGDVTSVNLTVCEVNFPQPSSVQIRFSVNFWAV